MLMTTFMLMKVNAITVIGPFTPKPAGFFESHILYIIIKRLIVELEIENSLSRIYDKEISDSI